LVEAGEGVVIGDAKGSHTGAHRFLNQLRWRAGAIGLIRVGVEID
jgi:hypothetical protein